MARAFQLVVVTAAGVHQADGSVLCQAADLG